MIFTVNRESLTRVVEQAAAISDKRSSMQILSHLVIEARQDDLVIRATDLESGFEGRVDLDKQAVSGAVAVDAKTLLGLLKNGTGEEVVGELNNENLRLKLMVGTATYHLPGLAADEFPNLPDLGECSTVKIPAEELLRPLAAVAPCMGNSSRHNLEGVRLEKLETGQVRAVATDGHRLSLVDFDLALELAEPILIPARGVGEILRLLKSAEEVELAVGRDKAGQAGPSVALSAGRIRLSSRLITDSYPDYQVILDRTEDQDGITLNRPALLGVLNGMSFLVSDMYRSVELAVNGRLTVSLDNPERGEVRDVVEIVEGGSQEAEAAYNLRYLRDMLRVMRSEEVTLAPLGNGSPTRFSGPGDEGFVGHIMPIQVQGGA